MDELHVCGCHGLQLRLAGMAVMNERAEKSNPPLARKLQVRTATTARSSEVQSWQRYQSTAPRTSNSRILATNEYVRGCRTLQLLPRRSGGVKSLRQHQMMPQRLVRKVDELIGQWVVVVTPIARLWKR